MLFRPLIRAVPAFLVVTAGALVLAPVMRAPVTVLDAVAASIVEPRTKPDAPQPKNPELAAIRAQALLPAPEATPAERVAAFALEAVGVPYRYGGESPEGGFDCSGLVRWAYGRTGLDVPHNSHALYGVGEPVEEDHLETGDVLFFEGLGHVGLYLGDGQMVHAPYTGKDVEVVSLDATNYGSRLIGARRMLTSETSSEPE